MAQSQFIRKNTVSKGFTLIEVMVALFILAVGLSSVAALLANVIGGTSRTEYMTQAATLASEKLEDLNRYPPGDPNVAVTTGVTAGSISADSSASVTSNGVTENVNYMDEVFFSPTMGAVSETISGLDGSGNASYTTTAYTPNGSIATVTTGNRASLTSGAIYFKRRWVIEANQPISGLRRITVYVFLENQSIAPNVSFQMTLVRP
jgi:prepilin-type N-terminal cleavage/methylation domain-containing protein